MLKITNLTLCTLLIGASLNAGSSPLDRINRTIRKHPGTSAIIAGAAVLGGAAWLWKRAHTVHIPQMAPIRYREKPVATCKLGDVFRIVYNGSILVSGHIIDLMPIKTYNQGVSKPLGLGSPCFVIESAESLTIKAGVIMSLNDTRAVVDFSGNGNGLRDVSPDSIYVKSHSHYNLDLVDTTIAIHDRI